MSTSWLEITDASGSRRQALRPGLNRLGGGDAEVALAGVGNDQLHISGNRVVFLGSGTPPACDGGSFRERSLDVGDCIEWSGMRLLYGVDAHLEEVPVEPTPAARATSSADAASPQPAPARPEQRAWKRVHAGLLVDLGCADRKTVSRWQKSVVEGGYDADRAAEEIIASARPAETSVLVERSGRLMRDFLMAPLMRGVRGAGRALRTKTKGGIAFLVSQFVALSVYSLIVFLSMVFLRLRGVEYDAFFDSILDFFRGFSGGGAGK